MSHYRICLIGGDAGSADSDMYNQSIGWELCSRPQVGRRNSRSTFASCCTPESGNCNLWEFESVGNGCYKIKIPGGVPGHTTHGQSGWELRVDHHDRRGNQSLYVIAHAPETLTSSRSCNQWRFEGNKIIAATGAAAGWELVASRYHDNDRSGNTTFVSVCQPRPGQLRKCNHWRYEHALGSSMSPPPRPRQGHASQSGGGRLTIQRIAFNNPHKAFIIAQHLAAGNPILYPCPFPGPFVIIASSPATVNEVKGRSWAQPAARLVRSMDEIRPHVNLDAEGERVGQHFLAVWHSTCLFEVVDVDDRFLTDITGGQRSTTYDLVRRPSQQNRPFGLFYTMSDPVIDALEQRPLFITSGNTHHSPTPQTSAEAVSQFQAATLSRDFNLLVVEEMPGPPTKAKRESTAMIRVGKSGDILFARDGFHAVTVPDLNIRYRMTQPDVFEPWSAMGRALPVASKGIAKGQGKGTETTGGQRKGTVKGGGPGNRTGKSGGKGKETEKGGRKGKQTGAHRVQPY